MNMFYLGCQLPCDSIFSRAFHLPLYFNVQMHVYSSPCTSSCSQVITLHPAERSPTAEAFALDPSCRSSLSLYANQCVEAPHSSRWPTTDNHNSSHSGYNGLDPTLTRHRVMACRRIITRLFLSQQPSLGGRVYST